MAEGTMIGLPGREGAAVFREKIMDQSAIRR